MSNCRQVVLAYKDAARFRHKNKKILIKLQKRERVLGFPVYDYERRHFPFIKRRKQNGVLGRESLLQNLNIRLQNDTQTWCKEVPWPELGDSSNATLFGTFSRLTKDRLMIDHEIDRERRDRIIRDLIGLAALTGNCTTCSPSAIAYPAKERRHAGSVCVAGATGCAHSMALLLGCLPTLILDFVLLSS